MDLLPYNKDYATNGNGFVNLGNSCYFNTLLQCLISCPSIFETLIQNFAKPHINKNPLALDLIKLYEQSKEGKDISQLCIPIWQKIISLAKESNNKIHLTQGAQEDAHEGLMMFLDMLDKLPEVKRLFEHRYVTKIYCDLCKQTSSEKKETNLVFETQPDLSTEQLKKFEDIDEFYNTQVSLDIFLMKQNGYVDEDYKCSKCGGKGSKFKSTTLTMVPEILPIVFKKYNNKLEKIDIVTPFPEKMEFSSKDGNKKIIYKLVAQCEHLGNMRGGHYYAKGLRKQGWKTLNDNSVSDGIPGPTKNTYMVFYHFDKIVDPQSAN